MTDQSCKCGRDRDRCICFSHPSIDAPPAITTLHPIPSSTSTARAIIDAATRNRVGFLKDTDAAPTWRNNDSGDVLDAADREAFMDEEMANDEDATGVQGDTINAERVFNEQHTRITTR